MKAYFQHYTKNNLKDLALLSVKAHENARRNPLAHMHHSQLTLDIASSTNEHNHHFLTNPELSRYLRLLSHFITGVMLILVFTLERVIVHKFLMVKKTGKEFSGLMILFFFRSSSMYCCK